MKRIISVLLAFGFALGISTSAFAIPAVCGPFPGNNPNGTPPGFARACVNGVPVSGIGPIVPLAGGFWSLPTTAPISGPKFSGLTFGVFGKEDPFLIINFGGTNADFPNGNDVIFSFSAAIPISLPAGASVVKSEITGTVTDFGDDGVSVSPVGSFILTSYLDSLPLGVDAGLATTQAGFYEDVAEGAGPIGPGNWILSMFVEYNLSGPFDSFAGTATVTVDPVPTPEPATLLLLGSGLVGLVFFRRRRKAA